MQVRKEHVRIAKVIGENEEGLTLFVPKDMSGTFHLTEGDAFFTMMFVKNDGEGSLFPWLPWDEEES